MFPISLGDQTYYHLNRLNRLLTTVYWSLLFSHLNVAPLVTKLVHSNHSFNNV